MATANVPVEIDGRQTVELHIEHEVIGDSGARPWAITPGGRFSKDYPGVRELAVALAELGNRVVIYDRPNTGASDVCFVGETESGMQADALAALVKHLDMAPAVISGGSGGSRVSLLTAARHPDVAAALAVWWISGGPYGLLTIGMGYTGAAISAVWNGGMEAVVKIPQETLGNYQEVMERNPANRQRILDQDPMEFRTTMERWLQAYCPCGDSTVPGLPDDIAKKMDLPTLVFRSGVSDMFHTRKMSEDVAALLPNTQLVEPPWEDAVWLNSKIGHRFDKWPLLAPIMSEWADKTLG
jgi:pimeloyl-ACP methyl ester carboxylesterase